MDKCIFCVGGFEIELGLEEECCKYGVNCIVEGKLFMCVFFCFIKVLLVGDVEKIFDIFC